MRNTTAPIILVLIVITPVFFVGMELPTSFQSNTMPEDIPEEILQETESRASLPEEDVELKMMFFTETVSSESGLYYVCRRGTDAVAYLGASMVKYLSGGTVFTLEFPGSRAVIPQVENPTGSTTNYLYGDDPSKWKAGIKDCSMLRYPDIYPGIDLVYKVQDGNLKYEFEVKPFADPEQIKLHYVDADSVEIREDNLIIAKDGSQVVDSELQVFQDQNQTTHVACDYSKTGDGKLGFLFGPYDRSRRLIIDPIILSYSTFLGGSDVEYGYAVAVEDGYAYMTGEVVWGGFPTVNAFDSTWNGNDDCFLTKFSADGQTLVYSTYIGGHLDDHAYAIAVEDGYAYLTGATESSDFPTVNAYNDTLYGTMDAFLTKFAADGQTLVYSTYLGGMHLDWGNDIVVEDAKPYLTGITRSYNFPTVDAIDSTLDGVRDCFVTKFTADGQTLVYSTYLGGGGDDFGYGIAVENGYTYLTGYTLSSDFPTVNAYDSTYNGWDCFVTKLSADGQSLVYSTFLGGTGDDLGQSIDVENEYAYVTGYTGSSDFPTTNAYDLDYNGNTDCFVTKLATDGQLLIYSSYLGGSNEERGRDIAVEYGFIFLTGYTKSNDFPTSAAYDSSRNGDYDSFVTKMAPDGQSLVYSTFLGGTGEDRGQGIDVEKGQAFIAGYTSSADFPTANAYDSTKTLRDCFLAVLSPDTDSDNLSDWEEEFIHGTDLSSIDSDNDNYLDGYEIDHGTDPLDPHHYPGMYHDLQYSSYLGGSLDDMGYDIAVENGFMYITGKTHSGDFPTLNAIDGTHNGMGDVYVTKMTKDGGDLIYSTFIGGSENELGNAITVNDGWVWVTGYTYSSDFPTVNAYDATQNGDRDCFALRLTPSGSSLWYSTYLGGSGEDFGEGIAVWNNLAYVTGSTTSAGYPVTTGAYDESHNGQQDAFVTKLSSNGTVLVYSTFLGGSNHDYGHGIAVEDAYAYVTGTTLSAFPLSNPYDGTHDIGYDGFVSKLSLDGSSLIFSTYLGGDSYDNPRAIAIEDGNAYVAGITGSQNFPTYNAYCSSHHGDSRDVFVTKFSADGQSLVYSTFLGGTGLDYGYALAVENGYAGVTGYTNSTDYPTTFSEPTGLGHECFVTMLSKHGRSIVFSTLLGGEGDDRGEGIAVNNGTIYATGLTRSNQFPTRIPFDSSYNGHWDAFVLVAGRDSDQDGLCNSWEDMLGSDSYHSDSDRDNYDDFYEFERDADPIDPDHYPSIHFDLQYSSYLGGSDDDMGQAVALEDGYVYITGNTYSSSFPTINALDPTHNGLWDVFIVKLSFDCRTIVYSTFLGGGSSDSSLDLAVDTGFVYVTGSTHSSDFPTVSANDTSYNGGDDCFVAKLAANGQSLVYSTFLGGWKNDYGRDIDVEDGHAFVTGYTESDDFPTANAYDSVLDGDRDGFVVKFSADGQYLDYSTFLGGSSYDYSYAIAVANGFAHVTGRTYSADFPTANAYDSIHDGNWDCFVTKFAADGQSLVYSTFLGGSGLDRGYSIAVEDGYVYVTGNTQSTGFPTVNAYDSIHNGGNDCFVTKMAGDGQTLIYSTFLGGSGYDYGYSISIENGQAYITGRTNSIDYPITLTGETGSGYESFVTMLSRSGKFLVFSTHMGGEGTDQGMGIASKNGAAYVTGYTDSSAFPTKLALNPSYAGGWDSFILVIGLDSDRDGLCNSWEDMLGTDSDWIDSDNDNFLDYYEFQFGSNATDHTDYPDIPQAWYDAIYEDLDGNATLIQNLIEWSDGNSSLFEYVMQQLDDNATLLQEVISWLDGNHTAIQNLYTQLDGNATLLLQTVDALGGNATELALVSALATSNYDWLSDLNGTVYANFSQIREIMDMLGATIGDCDYDGLDDLDELDIGTDLQCIDTDCDNLNDAFEVKIGTDPLDDDSDADTYLDGIEFIAGTDPLDPSDYPGAPIPTPTETTTTTGTTSPTPDELSPMMVALVIGSVGIGVAVVVIFVFRRRRMSS